jgi:succinyl-diaminopimelate desuccinylase
LVDLGALHKLVETQERQLVDFCQRLIRTRSLPGEEGDAARLIRQEMQALDYDDTWIDEVGNVIGVLRGSGGGRSVMLNTHLDHVDAGDPRGWPFPPYDAQVSDGQIWGRGACDIKGPTAAQVYGATLPRAAGAPLAGDVYVVGAVQEEVGGLGSLELADTTRTDCAVIGEASMNELRRGHRGRIELVVRIDGKACHASAPERGINPHYSLGTFLGALRHVAVVEDPVLGPETFAPSLIFTDQISSNVVPGEIRLHIDWRTVPAREPEEIRLELQRVLDGALVDSAAGEVEIKALHLTTHTGVTRDVPAAFPSFLLDEDDPLLTTARSALQAAYGHEVRVGQWTFATDGGHLFAAGVPCIGFGPGDERLAHTNRERVPISDLPKAALGNAVLATALTAPADQRSDIGTDGRT